MIKTSIQAKRFVKKENHFQHKQINSKFIFSCEINHELQFVTFKFWLKLFLKETSKLRKPLNVIS